MRTVVVAVVAALAVVSAVVAKPTLPAHECSDPCLVAARKARSECVSSASGAFTDAFAACVAHDVECVESCRFELQECRDGLGLGAALVTCDADELSAKNRCRDRFPAGSLRRDVCILRAEIAGSKCRLGAFRDFRHSIQDCRSAFGQCTDGCLPGGPAAGVDACKADAQAALKADLASCQRTYVATASGCINRDVTCVEDCGDARDTCNAPTQSMFLAASMTCTAAEKAAAAACVAANPGGGPALEQCLMSAQANAFECRQAALQAAAPGFAACAQAYVGCVADCPKASK